MNLIVLHKEETSQETLPTFYTLPETVVLKNEKPLFLPESLRPASIALRLAVRISNLGKCISQRFAHRYYDALTVVPQFYSSKLLTQAQRTGRPWSQALEFDGVVPLGQWKMIDEKQQEESCDLSLHVDADRRIEMRIENVFPEIEKAITLVSQRHTIRRGDMLLLGECGCLEAIDIDHRIETFLNGEKLLSFNLK